MDKELESLLVDYFQRGVLSLHQIAAVLKRYGVRGIFCQRFSQGDHKQFYFKFEQEVDDECARALIHELVTIKEMIYGKQ